ncbi:ABC transporter permease [Spiribacter insolitus]|uniref:FtsX-like permease family protein n=1 Tax=Spiribacter insolitus TaxID=3122417 RepID=A0ABV3T8N4_9GAMM
MTRLLGRIGRADLRRHPLQTGLAILGVAIAVAVVVAVDLANHSAREAMRVSLESVTGRATHQVVAGPGGVDEALYTRLRTELGVRQAAPVVQGGVTLADADERPLTLLGLDAFAEGPFQRPLGGGDALGDAFNTLLLRDDAVALGSGEAQRLGVAAGDTLALSINGRRKPVTVVAVVDDPDDQSRGLLLADIAAAQSLLGQTGRLDRIDLIIDDARAEDLAARLADAARIVPAAASAQSVLQMSRAFHINLTALSLLAVVVGAFLVFNTLGFLGVRRRPTIGILRAMGVQRREILLQILGDALLIGIVGTLIGLVLGFALAHGLVGLVLQTVNDVYFERAAGELVLSPWSLAAGLLVGLAGSVGAALAPAREAAATPPRAALSRADLETRARQLATRGGWSGIVVVVLGAAMIALSSGLVPAFVGLFALILGAALLAPAMILATGALLRPLMRGRPVGGLIVEGAVASLSRTGVAVAALSVAVAAVIGVAVMIASFRASVIDWLDGSLAADFYISAPGDLTDPQADHLAGLPAVDFVSRSQWVELATADGPVTIWALGLPAGQTPAVDIRRPADDTALEGYANDRAVLVSEPFAARRDLAPGDTLSLPVDGDRVDFHVAGIYRDYASPTGAVLMRRGLYLDLYDDPALAGIGVHAGADAGRDAMVQRLENRLAGVPGARVTDNAAVFEQSLVIFDRTFAITEVLRWLAGLVAFVGVVSALMALQLDRLREFAVLRAIGLGRSGLAGLVGGQSGLLGLIAGLWAVPLGIALAALLVFVINRRAYGWTMGFELEAGPVLEGVALAVIAALLAALYPAWRAARLRLAEGLKGE